MSLPLFVATVACTVPLVLFLAGTLRVRGWKNPAGKAVMVVAGAALAAFALALARQLGWIPPDWARTVLFIVVAGALWWQYLAFLSVQRDGQRRERRRIEREELQQKR